MNYDFASHDPEGPSSDSLDRISDAASALADLGGQLDLIAPESVRRPFQNLWKLTSDAMVQHTIGRHPRNTEQDASTAGDLTAALGNAMRGDLRIQEPPQR